jgi:hypothetical protein
MAGIVVLASLLLGSVLGSSGARAAELVDLALVLAADVSRSIDEQEFQLQRQGYAAALTSPRVLQAITSGAFRGIAVTYVEWSTDHEQRIVVDWTVVRDEEAAATVAAAILAAPRPFAARTSISAAIDFSMRHFDRAGVEAVRHVIDVSGDGTNNSGRAVIDARDAAVAAGATINGLAIINERLIADGGSFVRNHVSPPEGLPEYFRRNVIGGPGAFLMQVQGFNTFTEAITNKLVNEIAGLTPPTRHAAAD